MDSVVSLWDQHHSIWLGAFDSQCGQTDFTLNTLAIQSWLAIRWRLIVNLIAKPRSDHGTGKCSQLGTGRIYMPLSLSTSSCSLSQDQWLPMEWQDFHWYQQGSISSAPILCLLTKSGFNWLAGTSEFRASFFVCEQKVFRLFHYSRQWWFNFHMQDYYSFSYLFNSIKTRERFVSLCLHCFY